jgi:hypothetical protein
MCACPGAPFRRPVLSERRENVASLEATQANIGKTVALVAVVNSSTAH